MLTHKFLGLISLLMVGASYTNANTISNELNDSTHQELTMIQQQTSPFKEVKIIDSGLNMPISTFTVPSNWQVQHDIACNRTTGVADRYKFVAIGPKNQYIRAFAGTFSFGSFNGMSYQQTIDQAIKHVIGPENLQGLNFSEIQISQDSQQSPKYQELAQRLAQTGMQYNILETTFTGTRAGKTYKGKLFINYMFSQQGQYSSFGMLQPYKLLFSAKEHFDDLLVVAKQMEKSTKDNPEYSKMVREIGERYRQQMAAQHQAQMQQIDAMTQQSAMDHQRRMADQKASFASHQKNMAGLNQLQDVAHESYMKTLRSTGTFSTVGSDYSSHNANIDQIYERQSFTDPWSNSKVALDGQYEYNYTNGLGDYYRTNDPNFNPSSLQGDWNKIDPLKVK
jgi:hypothetical protein